MRLMTCGLIAGRYFYLQKAEKEMIAAGIAVPVENLKSEWFHNVAQVLSEATLEQPPVDAWMHQGGKQGTHTENLGFILADLQYVQRAYPNMTW
jgi:Uncharacterized conserved protein